MLVAQSLVVNVPSSEDVIISIPDTTPYPRAFYFENLSTTNTLVLKIENSVDGGITWQQIGATETVVPGGVTSRWVVVAGPWLRVRGSGNGNLYFGLSRFFKPITVTLPLVSLLTIQVTRRTLSFVYPRVLSIRSTLSAFSSLRPAPITSTLPLTAHLPPCSL